MQSLRTFLRGSSPWYGEAQFGFRILEFCVSGEHFATSPYVTATLVFHPCMGGLEIEKFGHFVEAASLNIAEALLDVRLEMDTKILV